MYIKPSKRKNGKTYLQIVEPYRENGKNKAKNILSLGYKEDLMIEHPDIENYLEEVLAKAKEEFADYYKNYIDIRVYRDQAKEEKNFGYVIVKAIYKKLGLRAFFNNHTRHRNLRYNLNQVVSLLVFNRFIDPSSKRKAYRRRNLFFERFDFTEEQMYESLSLMAELADKLQAYLYKKTQQIVELNKNTCKYDVTNFWFFSETQDENKVDSEGNIIKKGLKRYGPSKEGRHQPICQIGLLCDKMGIPLSFDIFSGGESEKTTFLPLLNKSQQRLGLPRILVIADRGINTGSNMYGLAGDNGAYKTNRKTEDNQIFMTKNRNGFIFGQTIRNQSEKRIEWILDPKDYVEVRVDDVICRFKSRIYNRTIKVNTLDGKKSQRKIRVKELIYYNSLYDKRCKHERFELLQKALKLLEDKSQYNQKLKKGGGQLIKSSNVVEIDGVEIESTKQKLEIDVEKIKKDAKLDGYYCLVTSELDMPDKEVWANYAELHDIEDNFRVSKHEFLLRPAFVWTEDSIKAHVLICFVSLLIFRILKRLCNDQFTTDEIFEGIKSYNCNFGGEGYYIFNKMNDVIETFNDLLDLGLEDHFMSKKEILNCLKY